MDWIELAQDRDNVYNQYPVVTGHVRVCVNGVPNAGNSLNFIESNGYEIYHSTIRFLQISECVRQ